MANDTVLPAMDFQSLRDEGIAHLQRLAGATWTDHNTHDPGITILEQLCYALSDLGYRSDHDLPDLLATGVAPDAADPAAAAYAELYQVSEILPSGPVTLDDLRRLVIDIDGVQNAWVEPVAEAAAVYDASTAEVSPLLPQSARQGRAALSPNLSDIDVQGLYRVRIEKSGRGVDFDGGQIAREAALRLNRYRGLGDDFPQITVQERQPVPLDVILEIAPAGDVADLLSRVYEAIAGYMSPAVPFHTLADMLARGWRVDEVFEGPLLDHGFIDADELAGFTRRDSVRISDLIHAVLGVPGVLAVKRMNFLSDGQWALWLLPIDPEKTAYFDLAGSSIRLDRRNVRVDQDAVRASARALFEARARLAAAPAAREDVAAALRPRAGRDRHPGRYYSVQHQFPVAYGVGGYGLAQTEPEPRKAQARQLKAYLMVFDQLLANQFAQLGNVARLFSIHDEGADSYFAQPIQPPDDDTLRLTELMRLPPDAHADRVQVLTESPEDGVAVVPAGASSGLVRRNRLLDHLLARLAEEFADYTLLDAGTAGPDETSPLSSLVRDKRAFLRDYPRIGHDRGVAADMLAEVGDETSSGLELRLRRKLGLGSDTGAAPTPPEQRFYLVEHVLLRPLDEDQFQSAPLMRAAAASDPYSLRFSLVFPGALPRLADPNYRAFIAQTVRDETPAHLVASLVWLDEATMPDFVAAFRRWQALWIDFQRVRLGLDADSGAFGFHNARLRGARNRLIDLIGLGDTYPLTDLNVVADQLKVAFGATAKIPIEDAQAGVSYQLCSSKGVPIAGHVADGNDDLVRIETPPVAEDTSYRILAIKKQADGTASTQTPYFLDQMADVKVGLDTSLAIRLVDLPLLDPTLPNAQDSDPRLVPWGTAVTVRVINTQEGVAYSLVIDGQDLPGSVNGDLGDIDLLTAPMVEDVAIQVRATKVFLASDHKTTESELLEARLALKVRANPALKIAVDPAPLIDYRQAVTLRLAGSQKSVFYQAFVHRVRDSEFVRDAAVSGVARVAPMNPGLGAGPVVMPMNLELARIVLPMNLATGELIHALPAMPGVRAPALDGVWVTPEGYSPLGGAAVPGNGAELSLPLGPLADDSVLIVQAAKVHDVGDGVSTIRSELGLDASMLVLVRPDPDHALRLRVPMAGDSTGATIQATLGQPGVFYLPSLASGGDPIALPAYFHQRDDLDASLNKGIGQLGVQIDFVVANDPPAGTPADGLGPEARVPPSPWLDIQALKSDSTLAVRAVKAQTGADAPMRLQAQFAAVAAASLAHALVDFGTPATVVVALSDPADLYTLALGGATVAPPVAGNKGPLNLVTPPLTADAVVELCAIRATDPGLPVERFVAFPLSVRPDIARPVLAPAAPVSVGDSVTVVVQGSQVGVAYQLSLGGVAVGAAVAGNGADIGLATGPIKANTVFAVQASRLAAPSATVSLSAQAAVVVTPAV